MNYTFEKSVLFAKADEHAKKASKKLRTIGMKAYHYEVAAAMYRVAELLDADVKLAATYAARLDTVLRDEIPTPIARLFGWTVYRE